MSDLPKGVYISNQGSVIVNDGFVIRKGKGFRLYSFDLRSKYATVLYTNSSETESAIHEQIILAKTERTLYADGPEGHTIIEFILPRLDDGFWYSMVDIGKYSLTVCYYTYPD